MLVDANVPCRSRGEAVRSTVHILPELGYDGCVLHWEIAGKVSQADLVQFTQQLATLQDAGLPIVRSLKILADQMKPGTFQNQLNAVTDDVEGGSTLSEALEKYPKTFDTLFVAMVKAGEAGGDPDDAHHQPLLPGKLVRLAFKPRSVNLERRSWLSCTTFL